MKNALTIFFFMSVMGCGDQTVKPTSHLNTVSDKYGISVHLVDMRNASPEVRTAEEQYQLFICHGGADNCVSGLVVEDSEGRIAPLQFNTRMLPDRGRGLLGGLKNAAVALVGTGAAAVTIIFAWPAIVYSATGGTLLAAGTTSAVGLTAGTIVASTAIGAGVTLLVDKATGFARHDFIFADLQESLGPEKQWTVGSSLRFMSELGEWILENPEKSMIPAGLKLKTCIPKKKSGETPVCKDVGATITLTELGIET